MSELYIGLMSGTSCDGIDAVLVNHSAKPELLAKYHCPFEPDLRHDLLALCDHDDTNVVKLYQTEQRLSSAYAHAVNQLLAKYGQADQQTIEAIGCHGQTIKHHPNDEIAFTVQLGDASYVAAKTGITTIADFRRKDLALGGQGAPFAPAFHRHVFSDKTETRVIVNIGGVSNITILRPDGSYLGFDTGPGNVLIDSWSQQVWQQEYDKDGERAQSGKVEKSLLAAALADGYFLKAPPKSTGREYFNLAWLNQLRGEHVIDPYDIAATLTEITARSIADAISTYAVDAETVYICGGGAQNSFLMSRIAENAHRPALSTASLGIDPQWVEAMAFSWLAQQTLHEQLVDLSQITGASRPAILGGVYRA